jgi:pimeloyl-ACP methyl ester carboxylesterase
MPYTVSREVNDGIERITYTPDAPKFKTPLVLQHGAWHGAWCWQWWQELFAEWGWISHAHSLPNHGGSVQKRYYRFCTLGYYLEFLDAEIKRCSQPPILIGHSMGGMLTQWYLKHKGDLPAAILVGSMPLYDNPFRYIKRDPLGMLLASLTLSGNPLIRSPYEVGKKFMSEGALLSAAALYEKLSSESALIVLQLNPLLWHPRPKPATPMLVLAGAIDALFTPADEKRLANFYGAEYKEFSYTAHNLMMEQSYRESAQYIHDWLGKTGLS